MFSPAQFRDRCNQLVGLPYVLGAEWASSCVAPCRPAALDCSELVEGVFRENGTPIGDLAASQFDKTIPVSGAIQVGDLVFLKNNAARWNGIGHVAVITAKLTNGDWEVIEAKGRAYGVVRTTLSSWKTRATFTGVRRFPPFRLADSGEVLPAPSTIKHAPLRSAETPVWLIQKIAGAKADGINGPKTRDAVRALQRRLGTGVDGVWGFRTAQKYLLALPNLRYGSMGLGVMLLQFLCQVNPDGDWGPRTDDAIAGVQAWAGLATDRVAGPATKRAITW